MDGNSMDKCGMDKYLISIIVPVYNKEQYLKKAIESFTNQTYRNLEIILVDDGSSDSSGLICDEYSKQDSRVITIHKENGGPSSAWKEGFRVSRGQYISFADSDDWIDDNMISEMAANLMGTDSEIILSDYIIERVDKPAEYVYQKINSGEYNRAEVEEQILPNLLGNESRFIHLSRCMKLVSRKLIEDNKDFCDPAILMGDDSTIMIPAIMDAERIFVMDHKAFYHYLYVDDSIVHRYDRDMFDNNEKLIANYKNTICSKLPDNDDLKQKMLLTVDRESIFLLLLVIKNEARGNPKGYLKNIRDICRRDEVRKLISSTPVKVSEKSNILLYLVLKHPNPFMVMMLRLAMIIYYR